MNPSAPIFLILAAVGGFTSGAYLDGEISPHEFSIPNVTVMQFLDGSNLMSFIQSAELSSQGQAIIEHAYIDFKIDQIPVEDYFKNVVSECIFRSDESFGGEIYQKDSIDDGICIICKLKGECTDVDEKFVNLPHGSRLGAINSVLATNGVFLSVDARNGRPNTAIIFDGDTPGTPVETAAQPDPDLRASGICPECAGLHIVVIPENINDANNNNLVDIPNDSSEGGTQRYQFELPRRIVSFDFVDMDRPTAAKHEARAYSDFSCTQLIGSPVSIPNGPDGDVQTIMMNIDNARCLEIEYHDSGGVTNLVLECMGLSMDGTILGKGTVNLAHGYTAPEEIHIPIEGMVDVMGPQHVDLKIQSVIMNYQGLQHGQVLDNQFLAAYGIKISGFAKVNGNLVPRNPIVFNSDLSGTADPDLEVDVGNISIVQENTNGCGDGICDNPDDNADGGIQQFQFNPKRYVNSLIWIDADRPEPFGTIFLYRNYDCTDLIDQGTANGGINIPFKGDGSTQVLVPINVEKVGCMKADYMDSGGLSKINLGCPLPEDPVTVPWFKGGNNPPPGKEPIYFIDFEKTTEKDHWTVDSSHAPSGRVLQILAEPTVDAYQGSKVLAGSGVISSEAWYKRNSLDISDYHNVMVSVWYSYKSTEAADSFALYYKDGSNWVPIFNVPDPQIGNGNQEVWKNAMVNIPDSVHSLVLQIRWLSSDTAEYVMIDSLDVQGIPN